MEAVKSIDQTKTDILGSLPPEIVQDISLYLTPDDLETASTCSKLWKQLLNRNYYWYKKCKARGYNELKDISKSAIYEKYSVRFPLYWQLLFNYNQLQYNWTNDIFSTTSVAGDSYYTLNYFDDEVLIASDISQNKIFIIDSCTGQIKNRILLPKCILRYVKYQNLLVILMADKSYTCISDKYLQVVTIEGKLLFNKKVNDMLINGDEVFTIRLKVYKTLIAINKREGDLHIIDFKKDTVTYKNANVCYVCFGNEMIAIGKTNGIIEVLDMNYNRIRIFDHGVRANINKIMISQDYMITLAAIPNAPYDNHEAWVWDLKKNIRLYTIKSISIFYERYTCSIYQDKFMYIKDAHSRNKNRKLVVVNLSTGNKICDIDASSYEIETSSSNGHYMFVTTSTREGTGSTAYMHCSQSGKEITFINDIYDNYLFNYGYSWHYRRPLRTTETKLAYITNKGDLFIRNYEKCMH